MVRAVQTLGGKTKAALCDSVFPCCCCKKWTLVLPRMGGGWRGAGTEHPLQTALLSMATPKTSKEKGQTLFTSTGGLSRLVEAPGEGCCAPACPWKSRFTGNPLQPRTVGRQHSEGWGRQIQFKVSKEMSSSRSPTQGPLVQRPLPRSCRQRAPENKLSPRCGTGKTPRRVFRESSHGAWPCSSPWMLHATLPTPIKSGLHAAGHGTDVVT